MFDAPVETWYVWAGLAVVSIVTLGLAVSLPRTTPPDAGSVAETVDTVAASDRPAAATHPVLADDVRISPYRIWLRKDGATSYATVAYGPVTPVRRGSALWDVLHGASPEERFDSPAAFRRAAAEARDRDPEWRSRADVIARRLSWEGVDVTLVG
jgi:hypothetical protein